MKLKFSRLPLVQYELLNDLMSQMLSETDYIERPVNLCTHNTYILRFFLRLACAVLRKEISIVRVFCSLS